MMHHVNNFRWRSGLSFLVHDWFQLNDGWTPSLAFYVVRQAINELIKKTATQQNLNNFLFFILVYLSALGPLHTNIIH